MPWQLRGAKLQLVGLGSEDVEFLSAFGNISVVPLRFSPRLAG